MKTIFSLLLTLLFASSIAAQEVKVKCYSAPAPALISDTMSATIIPMLPKGFRYEKLEMTVEGKPVAIHQGAGHFQYSIEPASPWINYIDTSSQDIVEIKLAGELTVWKSRKRKTRQPFQIAFPVIKPKISVTADFDSLVAFWRCGNHLTLQAQGVKDFTRYFQQMTADSCHIEVLDSVKGKFILEPTTKGLNIKQESIKIRYQHCKITGYDFTSSLPSSQISLLFKRPIKLDTIFISVAGLPAPSVDCFRCRSRGVDDYKPLRLGGVISIRAISHTISKTKIPMDSRYRCTNLSIRLYEDSALVDSFTSNRGQFVLEGIKDSNTNRIEVDLDIQRRNYKGEVFTIGSRSFNYSFPPENR